MYMGFRRKQSVMFFNNLMQCADCSRWTSFAHPIDT